VLLVEERHASGGRFWTFPGGGVRPGESLVDGLRRELCEEVRCDPVVQNVLSSYWYAHESVDGVVSLTTVFSCALRDRVNPVRSEGIVDTTWALPGDLPPETLPQVRQTIERRFEAGSGTSPRE
jgi:8-oxo-dGTP pyrophosphatase MutT (NUDIX family)